MAHTSDAFHANFCSFPFHNGCFYWFLSRKYLKQILNSGAKEWSKEIKAPSRQLLKLTQKKLLFFFWFYTSWNLKVIFVSNTFLTNISESNVLITSGFSWFIIFRCLAKMDFKIISKYFMKKKNTFPSNFWVRVLLLLLTTN